jgi:predicted RNase H-like HicB family nuclease
MTSEVHTMRHAFTLEYWQDEGWYVGRLKEVPGVFSQGETLVQLEENIRDAYDLVLADATPAPIPAGAESKPIEVEV